MEANYIRIPKHFRLPPETVGKMAEITTARDGLTDTQTVVWAIEELHRTVCQPGPASPRRPARKPTV